jgi:signal transduction histidine kinase
MKILIADDEVANLRLLRAALECEGHQVLDAANGVEVLRILGRESVDAVISDILMPSMDGFRLCQEIRKTTQIHRDIPIVLYTATYDSLSDRKLAESVGADAYILKPAPVAVLIDTIQELLQRGGARRSREAAALDETYVLERYNAALVRKLETRTNEAQDSLTQLRSAHQQIVQLNEQLEARVAQRTDELATANKELEAFSFSVSHDLRAPLRRISGFARLLADGAASKLDGEDRECLTHIIDGAAQMEQLIEALLQFARTSRTEMHFQKVDLQLLLDRALTLLRGDCTHRYIEWRLGPLPAVRGDRTLLLQVLVNLISNAIKYTRTREHALIEIGARVDQEYEILLFVRDNGVGFDMRYATKLFGVFQRMHRSDEFEGTGIGLANAQRIVARHGGSIWAEAEVGKGATFFVRLPLGSR